MFFFKQKTAYEMRISDWSSDVCSSDLRAAGEGRTASPCRALRRSRRRADRALSDRSVVRRCGNAREAGDRSGRAGAHQIRPGELDEDLFRVDAEHPALVRLASALVGPTTSRMVRRSDERRVGKE